MGRGDRACWLGGRRVPSLAVGVWLALGCAADPPVGARDAGVDAVDVAVSDVGVAEDVPVSSVRFADPTCFPAAAQLDRVVTGDLDHDGRLDAVLEYRESGPSAPSGYGYARNASAAGEVRFDARVDHLSSEATPLLASSATQVTDLDGDGFAELIRNDRWWRNTQAAAGALTEATFAGTGQLFGSGVGFTTPEPDTLTVLDLDLDGLRDVMSAQSAGSCNVLVYPQRRVEPAPIFGTQLIVRVYVRGLTRCTSIALGDLDGDGRPDVVATSDNPDRGSGEQGFAALRNESTPGTLTERTFGDALRWNTAATGERRVTRNARLVDVNGDGRVDLFYTLKSPDAPGTRGALRLHTGAAALSAETFGPAIDLPGSLGDGAVVSVIDLDGNGVPDVASALGDRVTVVQNLATRGAAIGPASFAVRAITLPLGSRSAAFAEVDGDGRADVIFVRDGGWCVMRNTTP